jgi:hypothetical protein
MIGKMMKENKDLIIGLDPDVEKSGLAIWSTEYKVLTLENLTFFQLFDFFKEHRERIAVVRIDCGIGLDDVKHTVSQLLVQMAVYFEFYVDVVNEKDIINWFKEYYEKS